MRRSHVVLFLVSQLSCPGIAQAYHLLSMDGYLFSMSKLIAGNQFALASHRIAKARRTKSGALIRAQNTSKLGRGWRQRRSSTASNTGTSSRSVASARNNSASLHPENNESESGRALRIDASHSRQSLGTSSRCGYWENVRAAAFCAHPGGPGKPSALSST